MRTSKPLGSRFTRLNRATVQTYDPVSNCQTQASSAGLAIACFIYAVKGFKNMTQHLGRYARSVILHKNGCCPVARATNQPDNDSGIRITIFESITDYVLNRAADQIGCAENPAFHASSNCTLRSMLAASKPASAETPSLRH